ncbi:unnamed protein product [Ectocarpus sp. 6 AP-2014]
MVFVPSFGQLFRIRVVPTCASSSSPPDVSNTLSLHWKLAPLPPFRHDRKNVRDRYRPRGELTSQELQPGKRCFFADPPSVGDYLAEELKRSGIGVFSTSFYEPQGQDRPRQTTSTHCRRDKTGS